ncbi:MAG: hypothetical protein HYX68_07325 [Planctomycetes bacterium]|nr:hypothetical protein [Planctomycetota bacterium]
MKKKNASDQFLLCVKNDAYPVSLEVRKIYQELPDAQAAVKKLVRIVDESGDDYLYPRDYFVAIELPKAAVQAIGKAS